MTVRVAAISIAPVKSLALQRLDRAELTTRGIAGDRTFFLVSDRGRLVTQRECPALVQASAAYDVGADELSVTMPDGAVLRGTPRDAEAVSTRFFGMRDVEGTVVEGPWAEALSKLGGMELRVVRSRGNSFDALPLSMLSSASVDALRANSGEGAIDERRFRPNVYLSGMAEAHGEDAWLGGDVRIGTDAVVRVIMRDPRCEMTTHDPATGERDFNTLRMITAYRTDQPKEVNFGVYAGVITRGTIAVGDEVVAV
jgi:uncharacterized protein YcbX